MNILIVTPFFKHDRNIASVRWTNIATRLAKRHNVIVVTQPHDDMDMTREIGKDEDGILVARLNQKTSYELFAVKHFGGATGDDWQTSCGTEETDAVLHDGLVRKVKNHALFLSMQQKAKAYAKDIERNVIPKDVKIDVVISSACPFIEMLFGYELKKRLHCKWISDFRDLPFQNDRSHGAQIMKNLMQKTLPEANAILTVVSVMKRDLIRLIGLSEDKIHVVTNGFSTADKKESHRINDNVLHIVHTGSLYGGTRRADLLFAAFKQLKETHASQQFVLDCAGGNNSTLVATAKKYGCEDRICDHGFLSREEALDLQAGADCLLAMIEPYALPAKMFEYVLSRKPIVAIILGEEKKPSEGKPFIERLEVGFVVEESSFDEDSQRLASYLIAQLERKIRGQALDYKPNEIEVQKYDHNSIVVQIENIIHTL